MPGNHQDAKVTETKTPAYWSGPNAPLLIIIAALLGLILLGGAFAVGRHADDWGRGPMMQSRRLTATSEFGRHMMGEFLNTADRVAGVVTAFNGNHFTIAGNGGTKDIETNSSTQYQGGSGVKVNDSVIVSGSTSNNQFTADQVAINP